MGCRIAEHDLGVKLASARRFVEEGHHLRLTITFRGGRELQPSRELLTHTLAQLEGECWCVGVCVCGGGGGALGAAACAAPCFTRTPTSAPTCPPTPTPTPAIYYTLTRRPGGGERPQAPRQAPDE